MGKETALLSPIAALSVMQAFRDHALAAPRRDRFVEVLDVGIEAAELALMVSGGLLYTAGAIVFASRRPDPRPATFGYHEVWHAFQVAAAACHYAMILLILRSS